MIRQKAVHNITDVLLQDPESRKTVQTTVNIDHFNYYSLNLIYTKRLTNWWTTNTSLLSFYNSYKGVINGFALNTSALSFSANTNNSFSIREDFSMECGFKYNHKSVAGVYMIKSFYNLSLGLQKSFFKKQLTLTINVTDLLWKNYPSGFAIFKNADENWILKRDTRVVTGTLAYKFGNGQTSKMGRKTAADEEKQRIQTN